MRKRALLVIVCMAAVAACREPAETRAPVDLVGDGGAISAIAYSGYREGHSPKTGVLPSQEQVAEDLRILEKNWRLIRVYSSDRHSEDVLEVIRREQIDLKVMLGIWLAREPGSEEENAGQIAEGVRLAEEYRDIVVAVNVGNEVLIEWTAHPVEEEQVIRYVRQVREAVSQPVTVADNYVWWRDYGADLAREVDFITIHTYPLWEKRDIDEGLSFTIENYESVRAAHPGKVIVIGEAGWATYTEGNLHVPRGGDETKQQRYYEELTGWAEEKGITVFVFEAFDEPWKETGTEQHWGLFTVDREAKPVMQGLYPELMPDGPTSPDYPDHIQATGPRLDVVLRAGLARFIEDGSVNPLGPGLSASSVVPLEGAEGGSALKLELTGESWSGVYLLLGMHDASGSDDLAMRLRLPDGVHALELKLESAGSVAQSVNLIDHAAGEDSGWTTFRVSLGEFDEIDLTQITTLGLWNPSDRAEAFVAGEMLVDDIRFE